ncbi:hypothetical protein [Halobacillus salinus]|uniref:WYL domain-containing protein n=1 Tax=Halobacillus salinus TaxID=192814 RepID=A0A4Z0H5G2_9BACI|nr:hypothetical protein [Halobacillus salinus]TGB04671.1 hypothetical protein E4663_06680 [Halobacillus salinus]
MESLLNRSKQDKRKIDVIYLSHTGEITQRSIRVVDVRSHYVVAFCYDRKHVRTFRKENILSAFPHTSKRRDKGVS